jgi:hypothetical protein
MGFALTLEAIALVLIVVIVLDLLRRDHEDAVDRGDRLEADATLKRHCAPLGVCKSPSLDAPDQSDSSI